jgi:RNase P subunit RPR2
MRMIARIIKAIFPPEEKPRRYHCPSCESRDLRILGSDASRLNGSITIVVTCLVCELDSEIVIDREHEAPHYLTPSFHPHARVVNRRGADVDDDRPRRKNAIWEYHKKRWEAMDAEHHATR